jgi:hypothetical protein
MPTWLEYHAAVLDPSSCTPFPLSLKVHPFYHSPLMNAMIFHIRCYSTEVLMWTGASAAQMLVLNGCLA